MKYIMKVTSEKIPNDFCIYWSGYSHKQPATQFKSKMKANLKKYKENPNRKDYKPYFPFAEDVRVEAKVIGSTDLKGYDELNEYCENLEKEMKGII
jgi:hypothetical protein